MQQPNNMDEYDRPVILIFLLRKTKVSIISKRRSNVGCQGGAHDSPRFAAGMTGEEVVTKFKEMKENEEG
jgi:hypothetical protein